MYSTSYVCERRITVGNFGEKYRSNFFAIVCQFSVLLPCLFVCSPALGADKRPVLFDGGSVANERISQDDGNIRPIGVEFIMSRSCLNSGESGSKGGTEPHGCGSPGVLAVDVKKKDAAQDCSKECCGDCWSIWWHWVLISLLPMRMFIGDALLERDETPNV
jgi:hypothetical protein